MSFARESTTRNIQKSSKQGKQRCELVWTQWQPTPISVLHAYGRRPEYLTTEPAVPPFQRRFQEREQEGRLGPGIRHAATTGRLNISTW